MPKRKRIRIPVAICNSNPSYTHVGHYGSKTIDNQQDQRCIIKDQIKNDVLGMFNRFGMKIFL